MSNEFKKTNRQEKKNKRKQVIYLILNYMS